MNEKKFYVFAANCRFSAGGCLGNVWLLSETDVKAVGADEIRTALNNAGVDGFAVIPETDKENYAIIKTAYDFAVTDIDDIIDKDLDFLSVSVPWIGTACTLPNTAMYWNVTSDFFEALVLRMMDEENLSGITELLKGGVI